MKIKSEKFNKIIMSCQEQPDLQMFLAEYGLPVWISVEVTDDDQAAIDMISNIHHVTYMTPRELIAEAGLTQTTFARRFRIPLRTVQDWCGGRREMPEYLKFMAAEILGLLQVEII